MFLGISNASGHYSPRDSMVTSPWPSFLSSGTFILLTRYLCFISSCRAHTHGVSIDLVVWNQNPNIQQSNQNTSTTLTIHVLMPSASEYT